MSNRNARVPLSGAPRRRCQMVANIEAQWRFPGHNAAAIRPRRRSKTHLSPSRIGTVRRSVRIRRKGDKRKMAIAARLRQETPMTLKWIAEHVAMGSASNAANLLAARAKRTK